MTVFRRLFVLIGAVLLAMLSVGSLAGAATTTDTTNVHGVTETFVDVLGCDPSGPLYTITVTYNAVEHTTETGNGGFHATFTQTGTFSAEAVDPTQQDASGRFTVWGGFNQSPGGSVDGTFTLNIRGRYDDGTQINIHDVDHFNTTPTGAEFFFTKCRE